MRPPAALAPGSGEGGAQMEPAGRWYSEVTGGAPGPRAAADVRVG